MAEKYAVKTGNWSDATVWNGGTKPGASDNVYANGFVVTIDEDVTVLSLRSQAGATAVEGGGFATSGSVTITADVYAGGSSASMDTLRVNSGGVLIGNSTGGSATSKRGTYCINGGYQIGNSTGGSGLSSYGTYCTTGGYQVVGQITDATAPGVYGSNASFLFFNGLGLGDISGSGNTELSQTDYLSLVTEHLWGPVFLAAKHSCETCTAKNPN